MSRRPETGIIEGYYGRPWSWAERSDTALFLGRHGFGFYIYAPKADPYLRKRWQEDHPPEAAAALAGLARSCRDAGIRFGVGLSPYEIFRAFDAAARAALERKLRFLDGLGIDDLALLFDDMRGDLPELAARQLEVAGWVGDRTGADRLIVCPTYYTEDPVLD
ncbi:MAG: beta-N-acetylglucosaminidase domain-containing protein, partial [Gemmatimonadota bacterium]